MMTADVDSILRDLAAGQLSVADAQARLRSAPPARAVQKPKAPRAIPVPLPPNGYGYGGHNRLQVEVVHGESLRIFGLKHDGTGTRTIKPGLEDLWSAIDAGCLDALIPVCDLMEGRGYESTEFMRNVTRDILSGRETNVPGRLECLRSHCQDYHPNHVPFDRTFRIGEMAEHGSYNLSYYGPIRQITAKTVTIADRWGNRDKLYRPTVAQFVSRNWDWNCELAAQRNAEWSD